MSSNIFEFQTALANPDLEIVQDIEAGELSLVIEKNNLSETPRRLHLIDVRMPDEYTGELGHIKDTKLIPLPSLPEHLDDLPKDETVVFVCRSGGRSARATAFALSNGFEHVYNLKGGMLEWNALRLPVLR